MSKELEQQVQQEQVMEDRYLPEVGDIIQVVEKDPDDEYYFVGDIGRVTQVNAVGVVLVVDFCISARVCNAGKMYSDNEWHLPAKSVIKINILREEL